MQGITTGTADMHVFGLPDGALYESSTYSGNVTLNDQQGAIQQNTSTFPGTGLGMLSVVTCPSGGITFPNGTNASANTNATSLNPPISLSVGKRRLLGWGVEVHDTTPELYRGGTVTTYQVPQSNDLGMMRYWNTAGTVSTSVMQNFIISSDRKSVV